MSKYVANAYLVHHGQIVEPGEELDLTEEQAKRLGNKVITPETYDLSKKTLAELKDLAKAKNITGYSTLNKTDLISRLEETETVSAGEPVSQPDTNSYQEAPAQPANG